MIVPPEKAEKNTETPRHAPAASWEPWPPSQQIAANALGPGVKRLISWPRLLSFKFGIKNTVQHLSTWFHLQFFPDVSLAKVGATPRLFLFLQCLEPPRGIVEADDAQARTWHGEAAGRKLYPSRVLGVIAKYWHNVYFPGIYAYMCIYMCKDEASQRSDFRNSTELSPLQVSVPSAPHRNAVASELPQPVALGPTEPFGAGWHWRVAGTDAARCWSPQRRLGRWTRLNGFTFSCWMMLNVYISPLFVGFLLQNCKKYTSQFSGPRKFTLALPTAGRPQKSIRILLSMTAIYLINVHKYITTI